MAESSNRSDQTTNPPTFNSIRDKLFKLMREKADAGDKAAQKFLEVKEGPETTKSRVLKGRSKSLRLGALRARWLKNRIKDQKNRCALCGTIMAPSGREPHAVGLEPSLDHIKPLSKGGLDHWENTQAVHWKCNQEKGANYNER